MNIGINTMQIASVETNPGRDLVGAVEDRLLDVLAVLR
jgi:hypothetical protein